MFLFERKKSIDPPVCVLTVPSSDDYTFYHVYVERNHFHFHYEKLVSGSVYVLSPDYVFTRLIATPKYIPTFFCVPYLYWMAMPRIMK
jgi:hypothetical protein